MHRYFLRPAICLTLVTASLLVFGTAAYAQLVQVGPGYVKAPFVRIYARPDGSSFVRAPFVGVYTPPYLPEPRELPRPEDFAQMDWRELRATIRDLAVGLDAELDQYPTGELWKVELKTADVRALTRSKGRPSADEQTRAQDIRVRYQAARDNPKARPIPNLGVFKALYAGLREFSAPPEEHLHRRLSAAADDLKRALDEIPTGKGWQKYLALSADAGALRLPTSDMAVMAAPDLGDLEDILDRYDSVSRSEEFRVIAELLQFKTAHDSLAAYLGELRNPPPDPQRPAEEIPTPRPRPRPRSG